MSRKDDQGVAVMMAITIGLLVAAVYAAYSIGKLIWWGIQSYRNRNKTPALTITATRKAARRSNATSGDPWLAHCIEIENAWNRGDYDWARQQLQRIAYGMVEPSVTDTQRADFTRLMTAFAKEDPLYNDVMQRVIPMITANPGIVQSQIYKGQPDDIKEQMRYVLYFANELGHINRIKKGNSYQLMLPDMTSNEATTSPENKAEVGRMMLTSSIAVNKFTEADIRENANENRWFYEPAYQQVMATIEADPKQIKLMFNDLLVAHAAGSPRREYDVVKQYLPDGTWRWPAYEAFVLPDEEANYKEELADIKSANLFAMLMWQKSPEIRALYAEYMSNSPKLSVRKKAETANALIDILTSEQRLTLTKRLRDKAKSELVLPGMPDYQEMRELLCNRISSIAYEINRRQQRMELVREHSIWEFHVSAVESTPKICQKRHGKKFRYDNSIWNNLPCENLKCSCYASILFD
jgi:hypothetical protein